MRLVAMNWKPSDHQLRQFGLATLVLPPIAWSWGVGPAGLVAVAVGAVMAAGIAYVWPQALKTPYVALTFLTLPVGMVMSELLLLTVFFLVFVPLGLLGRLCGRNIMSRGFEPAGATYWEAKAQPAGPSSYFRQF